MGPEIYAEGGRVSIGRAAMLLAMSQDREEEETLKAWLRTKGLDKVVATEVSGQLADFKQKVVKNAVAAALNTGVVGNDPRHLHGVNHAVLEAAQGILLAAMANPSIKVKLAIVSNGGWVAVGMFGVAALHLATNHERAGLGIMHL